MKKVYFVVLFMSLFLITGCENMEEVTKNEYISMKNETLSSKEFTTEFMPVEVITEVERINAENVRYKATITNPTENMHDIKVMLVHNYYNENVFPSIGIFDETKELLIDDAENFELTLESTINTTENISNLNLELKLLIEYIDDNGEKKDIYYKTT